MRGKMYAFMVARASRKLKYNEMEHKAQVVSMQHSNVIPNRGEKKDEKIGHSPRRQHNTYIQHNQIRVSFVLSYSLFMFWRGRGQCYYATYHYGSVFTHSILNKCSCDSFQGTDAPLLTNRLALKAFSSQNPNVKKSKWRMDAYLVRDHFLRKSERLMVVVLTCFVSFQLILMICTWPFIIVCAVESFIPYIYSILLPFLIISTFIHPFVSIFSLQSEVFSLLNKTINLTRHS